MSNLKASEATQRSVGSSHDLEEQRTASRSDNVSEVHDDRLHTLQLALLEIMLSHLPQLREVGGVRAIPFMQVMNVFLSKAKQLL